MKRIERNKILLFMVLFCNLSPEVFSQNDTLIKYLSSQRWIWSKGAFVLDKRDSINQVHRNDTLYNMPSFAEALKKDTVKLYGVSFSFYDNMQLSFSHINYANSDYDTIAKCPSFIFTTVDTLITIGDSVTTLKSGDIDSVKRPRQPWLYVTLLNKYSLTVYSNLELLSRFDESGKEITGAAYHSIISIDFSYNKKTNTLDMVYDCCLDSSCNKIEKRYIKYKVLIKGAAKVYLIPVLR